MFDPLELLGVLLVLAVPLAALWTFVSVIGLRRRVAALEGELARLAQAGARMPQPLAAPLAAEPEPARSEPARPEAATPEAAKADIAEPQGVTPEKTPEQAPEAAPQPIPQPAPQSAAPRPAKAGFEEAIGTRWSVWLGGIALALGGIFLVRYSIEEGLLGPGLRLILGALFAAALIAAGEWTRRNEARSGLAGIPAAHVPSILTAAGTATAYATAYAAYALYGFLPAPLAFVVLGVIALATLAAALLHGWPLAALGTIAAYVTPLLVSSDTPNFAALFVYLAVVTAAAHGLARLRFWRWLVIATLVLSLLWVPLALASTGMALVLEPALYVLVIAVVFAALIAAGVAYGPAMQAGRIDRVTSLGFIAHALVLGLVVMDANHAGASLFLFALLLALVLGCAWRSDAASAAVPGAGVVAALVIGEWALEPVLATTMGLPGPMSDVLPEPAIVLSETPLLYALGIAAAFLVAGLAAQLRVTRAWPAIAWAGGAALVPLAVLAALYARLSDFERSLPFAGFALVLAAIYLVATEVLLKRGGRSSGLGVIATAGLSALALAFTMAFEKGALTIALSLVSLAAAYVSTQRPLPLLRWVSAIAALVVLARIFYEPILDIADVGTTPIFNWLLYCYGLPALSFWMAGMLLRRGRDDAPVRLVESMAVLFTALTLVMQVRHWTTGGDMLGPRTGLDEFGGYAFAGLAMAIGLEWVRQKTGSGVHAVAAAVATGASLTVALLGCGLAFNPVFTGEPVPGLIVNAILVAFGFTAVLAALLAWLIAGQRAPWYRLVVSGAALALALLWVSLQIRRVFQGPVLSGWFTSSAELYTYSAVWLAFGVALLLGGLMLRSQPARIASAIVILLTVAKVFLVDMSDLTGVWRALSFIGLGLVLVGIGLLYQRLLFARPNPPPAPPSQTST
jgi:uncharacterized membrane protein